MSIFIYQNKRGIVPFIQWKKEVCLKDPSMNKKINNILTMMEKNTLLLKAPNVKRMISRLPKHRHLFKIRIGKYRMFFIFKNNNYYILHAFQKNTQTTPKKECVLVDHEINEKHYILFNEIKRKEI